MATDFETMFDSVGTFGPYQVQVFVLVSILESPAAWAMLLPVFIGATPDWWCNSATQLNGTMENVTNRTITTTPIQLSKTCQLDNNEKCSNLQFDNSQFTSIVSEFGLVCDLSYVSDLITTLQMAGLFLGATLSGQLADTFGRKKVLFAFYGSFLLFGLGSAFSKTWMLYAALRFLVGVGLGGFLVVNFTLPMEFVGVKWRTFCGCLGFWAVGVMIISGVAYFIRDWRHLCITSSVAGMPLMLLWWFIPESSRWLASRDRFDEAEEIIVKMATRNKKPLPDMSILRSFAKTEEDNRKEQRKLSYWHLCLTPKAALNTFICIYGWFASSSVYYGVSFNLKNLSGDRYLNLFLSGLVEIPALIFVLLVNNRIGRRFTVLGLFLLAGSSLLSIMLIIWLDPEKDDAILALALIGKSAISGGWAAVQIFSAEQFPTLVRNLGVGSCAMAARVGGVVAPQFVLLNETSFQLPFIIFGCISVACAVLMLFIPETANQPLKDRLEASGPVDMIEMSSGRSSQDISESKSTALLS